MRTIEEILKDACEDQRDALRRFHASGSLDDCVGVHFDACEACERAVEEVIALRCPPSQAERPVVRPKPYGAMIGLCLLLLGAFGSMAYVIARPFFDDDARAAAEGMQGRIRFVRMPGRPDTCVAGLPGVGGYGPTFVGSARCREVDDRVAFDEDMSFHLGRALIVRIKGTQTCLASVGESQFTLPCRAGDI